MTEELDDLPELVDWRKTDERGRVNLGTEFADQEVQIAVLSVKDAE